MRKINLKSYEVTITGGEGKEITLPFDVKGSIANALYHPDLRLHAKALLDNYSLVQKITDAGDSVLLEEEEYNRIKYAFDTIQGFTRNDVELIRRVLQAPTVPVKEG